MSSSVPLLGQRCVFIANASDVGRAQHGHVCYVNDDNTVNIACLTSRGAVQAFVNVNCHKDGDKLPEDASFCILLPDPAAEDAHDAIDCVRKMHLEAVKAAEEAKKKPAEPETK
jgi:hypothetical protein